MLHPEKNISSLLRWASPSVAGQHTGSIRKLPAAKLRHFISCDTKILSYIKQEPNHLVSYPESNEISSNQDTGSTTQIEYKPSFLLCFFEQNLNNPCWTLSSFRLWEVYSSSINMIQNSNQDISYQQSRFNCLSLHLNKRLGFSKAKEPTPLGAAYSPGLNDCSSCLNNCCNPVPTSQEKIWSDFTDSN